jgi:hypothetical protein
MSAMKTLLAALLLLASLTAAARDGRNFNEVRKFRLANPCPVTGEVRGKCPGYEVDHIEARRCGGKDKASNMQWLSIQEHRKKSAREARVCRGKWR